MDLPSLQDHRDYVKIQNENRAICEGQISSLRGMLEYRSLTPYMQNNLDTFPQLCQDIETNIKQANESPKEFGWVKQSSGIFTHPVHKNIVDWALIALDHDRFSVDPHPKNLVGLAISYLRYIV